MSNNLMLFRASCGREIFYSYERGSGLPVLFLNGLDDSLEVWRTLVHRLKDGRPRVFVDLIGQGASLERERQTGKEFVYEVGVEVQGQIVIELLKKLSMETLDIVGNSYGAGVAIWMATQKSISAQKIILFNPFLLRLDLAFPLARVWSTQYSLMKRWTPGVLSSPFRLIERSYSRFIEKYMDHRFSFRIPDEELRAVKVQLSKGIMQFNSFEYLNQLPEESIFLFFSELDTLVPRALYLEFWFRLASSKKVICHQLMGGDHIILETAPQFVASRLELALMPMAKRDLRVKNISREFDLKSAEAI